MEFVNVIVDISHEKLDRIFQYRIPEELQGKISTGMQVQVPFGMGNRTIKGYVTGVTDVPDYPVEKIKPVTGLVDGAVPAESELIALAAWMKEFYGSTMNQALKTVLPVKQEVSSRQEKCIVLAIPREEAEQLLKEVLHKNFRAKARLLAGLLDHDGKLSSKEAADLKITSSVIQGLERDGVVRQISRVQYRNPFAGKFEKLVQMEQRKSKNVKTAMKGEIRKLKPLTVAFYRDFRPEDDKYIMKKMLAYYLEHVDSIFYSTALKKVEKHYPQHLSAYIDSLYDHSPLRNQESMLALLDSVPTQGTAALSQDGLYQLSLGFYLVYVEKINRLKQAYQNKNMKLYSLYLQAYAEKNKGTQIAFDANRTLRYSTGKVKAAVPSEGVIYTPFTTVDGMLSRHRLYAGNKDFNLPARFVKLIEHRQPSNYFSQKVTPTCCFLTDAHTTSGSSGSPVLNAKGEVVGINFDRIWQGLSSDYETAGNEKSRNIAVDIRYVLWTLEQYSRSQYILDELDIH